MAVDYKYELFNLHSWAVDYFLELNMYLSFEGMRSKVDHAMLVGKHEAMKTVIEQLEKIGEKK